MLWFFILLTVVFSAWTGIVLINSPKDSAFRNHTEKMSNHFKEIILDFRDLLGLLVKDSIIGIAKELKIKSIKETPISGNEVELESFQDANLDLKHPNDVISESDYATEIALIADAEEDVEVSSFSPEVIQIIQEEEDKVA